MKIILIDNNDTNNDININESNENSSNVSVMILMILMIMMKRKIINDIIILLMCNVKTWLLIM